MTFLGADLSLTSSGIVTIGESGAVIENARFQPKSRGVPRLQAIGEELADRIVGNGAEEVCIEAPFAAGGPMLNAALMLAELHGAVKVALRNRGIKQPYYVAPMTLKKFTTGSGKAEKGAVQLAIARKWGIEIQNNDLADGYALARMAGVIAGKIPAQGYELECVKTVLKSPLNAERVTA